MLLAVLHAQTSACIRAEYLPLLQELTVGDTDLLLKAYKQAARVKQKDYMGKVHTKSLDDTCTELLGRFSHYSSGSLRLADVKLVLQALKQNSDLS